MIKGERGEIAYFADKTLPKKTSSICSGLTSGALSTAAVIEKKSLLVLRVQIFCMPYLLSDAQDGGGDQTEHTLDGVGTELDGAQRRKSAGWESATATN